MGGFLKKIEGWGEVPPPTWPPHYWKPCQQLPKLLNIGSCLLHILHGTFKVVSEKASWEIKSVLKASFHYLHDTPARRDNFISVTGCLFFPLQFLCHTMD